MKQTTQNQRLLFAEISLTVNQLIYSLLMRSDKETGFLPNFWAVAKYFRKNPVSGAYA